MTSTETFTLDSGYYKHYAVDLDEGFILSYTIRVFSGSVEFYVLNATQFDVFKTEATWDSLHDGGTFNVGTNSGTYTTTSSGTHYLVIYNPNLSSAEVEFTANVDLFAELWALLEQVCMVCVGIVVIVVVVIVLLIIASRKKGPKQGTSMGGGQSYSLDDVSSKRGDDISRYEPKTGGMHDEPYKRDKFLGKKR